MSIAAARAEPIPVYAEMSSINPVLLFPAALSARGDAVALAFVASLTLGAGQFCTNPDLVIAIDSPDLDNFCAAAAGALSASDAQVMLTPGIHASFERGVAALETHAAVRLIGRGKASEGVNRAVGALFETDATEFLADEMLAHEIFGSSSLVVRCRDTAEFGRVVAALEGQLTATLILDEGDEVEEAAILPTLARKAGRILANGWPTGVEVSHAMVHGGPYPATSDGRSTSVGTLAIARFLRPVCFQNLPATMLPDAVKPDNPWIVPRQIDGVREQMG